MNKLGSQASGKDVSVLIKDSLEMSAKVQLALFGVCAVAVKIKFPRRSGKVV